MTNRVFSIGITVCSFLEIVSEMSSRAEEVLVLFPAMIPLIPTIFLIIITTLWISTESSNDGSINLHF